MNGCKLLTSRIPGDDSIVYACVQRVLVDGYKYEVPGVPFHIGVPNTVLEKSPASVRYERDAYLRPTYHHKGGPTRDFVTVILNACMQRFRLQMIDEHMEPRSLASREKSLNSCLAMQSPQ